MLQWLSLTLGVCGAADDIAEFGFEARVGGAVLAMSFEAARTEWDHTLQGRVRPQTLALMDRQCRGVVNQQTSILCTNRRSERLRLQALNVFICQDHSQRDQLIGISILENLSWFLTVNRWNFWRTSDEQKEQINVQLQRCLSTKQLFFLPFPLPYSFSQTGFDIEQPPRSAFALDP